MRRVHARRVAAQVVERRCGYRANKSVVERAVHSPRDILVGAGSVSEWADPSHPYPATIRRELDAAPPLLGHSLVERKDATLDVSHGSLHESGLGETARQAPTCWVVALYTTNEGSRGRREATKQRLLSCFLLGRRGLG